MSWLLPLIALTTAGLLLSRPPRKNRAWRATVTPLASIIGSGFLVVAPILGHLLGIYAFLGMLLITLLAIEIGEVIRFNIRHAEPLIGQGGLSPSAEWTERTANLGPMWSPWPSTCACCPLSYCAHSAWRRIFRPMCSLP